MEKRKPQCRNWSLVVPEHLFSDVEINRPRINIKLDLDIEILPTLSVEVNTNTHQREYSKTDHIIFANRKIYIYL